MSNHRKPCEMSYTDREDELSETIVISFKAAPGNEDALLKLLQHSKDLGLKAKGCEAFDVWQSKDEPARFVMFERWRSLEDHHANFTKNIGELEKIAALLAEPIHGGVHHAR
jgi:quinol monooxygenase YgiN